jgi:hypothetical protein
MGRVDLHLSEIRLSRETFYRLDKVLIGISVGSEDLAEKRDHGEGVLTVDATEGRER